MTDVLSLESILKEAGSAASGFDVRLEKSVSSTNTLLKEEASRQIREAQSGAGLDGAAPWRVLIAEEQTAGRGRMGRSFESPAGSGIYLSVLMRPDIPAEKAVRITTAAAVAACRAIEECTDEKPQIKWVNDVYIRGKKVCGILTEGAADPVSGKLLWAVMGIGFNVYEPENGFSEPVKSVAGAITQTVRENLRNRLSGAFLRHFRALAQDLQDPKTAEEYKRRSFLIGSRVSVIRTAGFADAGSFGKAAARQAQVLDIDEDCRLVVRYEDGSSEALSSGEVSVRENA